MVEVPAEVVGCRAADVGEVGVVSEVGGAALVAEVVGVVGEMISTVI